MSKYSAVGRERGSSEELDVQFANCHWPIQEGPQSEIDEIYKLGQKRRGGRRKEDDLGSYWVVSV